MGEDFLRRRSDRFVRQRDAYFTKFMERNLFSMIPPDVTTTVYGSILNAVAANTELWAPELLVGHPIRFFRGALPSVEVKGSAAEALVRTYNEAGAPLLAEVVEVDSIEEIAWLRVRSVR